MVDQFSERISAMQHEIEVNSKFLNSLVQLAPPDQNDLLNYFEVLKVQNDILGKKASADTKSLQKYKKFY